MGARLKPASLLFALGLALLAASFFVWLQRQHTVPPAADPPRLSPS